MLAVIVDILKIIGIILLCIIAILLTVILLVLFCPWRYCVDVSKEEKLTGKAAVSWLLLLLRIEVIYQEAVNLRIRILGIPIYDKLRREVRAAARKEKAAAKEQKKAGKKENLLPDMTAASVDQKENALTGEQTSEDGTSGNPVAAKAPQGEETASEKHTRRRKERRKTGKVWWEFPQYFFEMLMGWAEKLLEMLLSLPELVEGPVERLEKKIASVVGRVEYYTKLLQKKGSKWVIDFLKVKIFKVLKHIRPRNARINLYYAADDPAKVADMMAYYGMALPWLPRHTNFTAELGEPKLEGSIRIKGRVCLIVLLWHGLGICLNKKVKTFLKLLKEGQKM
ncbi:MAG: hypothetical protein K2K20_06095 [Lachnospiraceae bacterium]|nr:hypothetical protein [Lachnospiraceae bacterium]